VAVSVSSTVDIVDGQQRLTRLYAVMTGRPVVKEDYSTARIRVALRPTDATFAVTDAAAERDPEFIPDVSVLWQPGGRHRINSEGVTLKQADFILTLMSVFWEKGRQQLEDFARGCKAPPVSGASPFNWASMMIPG
jgi:hypothetical protein